MPRILSANHLFYQQYLWSNQEMIVSCAVSDVIALVWHGKEIVDLINLGLRHMYAVNLLFFDPLSSCLQIFLTKPPASFVLFVSTFSHQPFFESLLLFCFYGLHMHLQLTFDQNFS